MCRYEVSIHYSAGVWSITSGFQRIRYRRLRGVMVSSVLRLLRRLFHLRYVLDLNCSKMFGALKLVFTMYYKLENIIVKYLFKANQTVLVKFYWQKVPGLLFITVFYKKKYIIWIFLHICLIMTKSKVEPIFEFMKSWLIW